MKDQIDEFLARRVKLWVEGVQRHAGPISLGSVVITLALGVYAGLTLGINSDNVRMLADTLPSKIAYTELARYFPNLDDALLIVIDGKTPELARTAADSLALELAKHTDDFSDVYIPGGGSFFEQNGLLYRSLDDLDEFELQMARLQPVLAELEADPSIASLARIVRLGLDAVRDSGESADQWSMLLDRVGDATVTVFDEFPIAVSWEEVLLRGSSIEAANQRVLIAHPILDFGDVLAAAKPMRTIREIAEAKGFVPERGVTVRITGNPALNYEEMIGLAWDIGGAGVFCFLLVCSVIYRALRSIQLVIASISTLLMGLVWTAAFAALAVQQLNLLSLAFAVLFIGLGVDFAIHLGMRYIDLMQGGMAPAEALPEAATRVGSSLVICTVTTAIGFYVFLPSDYRGVAELGLIAGTGMFVILLLTLTTLPALLSSWLRIEDTQNLGGKVRFDAAWLATLAAHPGVVRSGAALALVLAAFVIVEPGPRFDTNVIRMRDPTTESVQAFTDLVETSANASPWYANFVADDLASADALAARVAKLPTVEHAITLTSYLPLEQEEKLELLADVAMMLEAPAGSGIPGPAPTAAQQIEAIRDLRDFLEAGWVEGIDSPVSRSMRLLRERLDTFLVRVDASDDPAPALAGLEKVLLSRLPAQIQRLRTALMAKGVTREDLPEKLTLRMLAPTGQARVQVFPAEDLRDNAALSRFVESIRGINPMASGISVNLYDFGRATVSSFRQALILALGLITVLLILLWRNVIDVALALAPLLLSAALTVAAMAVLDIPFNFANVIVLPLLFGVGVDSGIHLVHRAKSATSPDETLLGTTTARAVFYSAITTMVSFGTLAFSSHRGVASLGVLLSIGMLLTVVCNLVVLPALLALRSPSSESR